MNLDRSKKYEFFGDVYEWTICGYWYSDTTDLKWSEFGFQHFANNGAVKEVREPIKSSSVVEFPDDLCDKKDFVYTCNLLGLTKDQARGNRFRVEATQVMDEDDMQSFTGDPLANGIDHRGRSASVVEE